MRNYQLKRKNPYQLDGILFRRMIYLVKDYTRMQMTIDDIAGSSPCSGISVSDGQFTDPTLYRAMRIERMSEECAAIETALLQIPEEYREVIFKKVCHDDPYPIYADPSTYSRWKCRFLHHLAEILHYI